MQKVTRLRDIEAPCEAVFSTVVDIHLRMQLSPLWGLSRLLEVSDQYPLPGSRYRIQVIPGAPFGTSQGMLSGPQSALTGLAEVLMLKFGQTMQNASAEDAQPPEAPAEPPESPVEHDYIVVEYQPAQKFVYQLDDDCKTLITWTFKPIPSGTRLTYEECFCDETLCDENFIPTMHQVIKEWLTNLKRYCELEGSGRYRLVKWFLDHFFLRLRPDQRRAVILLLLMQAVGVATFLIAAILWGIPRLLF